MKNAGTFNPAMVVHGTQAVTLHREVPVDGKATLTSAIVAMYDKGKAGIIVTETKAVSDGEPLYTLRSSIFIRGEGGFGGERGPSGPQNVPPDRAPDHEVSYTTLPTRRWCTGSPATATRCTPIPSFAALAGFDRPILHGLCSYGFTGRALLHAVCGSDPARFHHIEGRFASPVLPGDTLTVAGLGDRRRRGGVRTSVGDRAVIDQGLLRLTTDDARLRARRWRRAIGVFRADRSVSCRETPTA